MFIVQHNYAVHSVVFSSNEYQCMSITIFLPLYDIHCYIKREGGGGGLRPKETLPTLHHPVGSNPADQGMSFFSFLRIYCLLPWQTEVQVTRQTKARLRSAVDLVVMVTG